MTMNRWMVCWAGGGLALLVGLSPGTWGAEPAGSAAADAAALSRQLKERLAAPEIVTAAATGNLARVKALIESGVKPDVCNAIARQTALMAATMHGRADVVEFLLGKGADVLARDANQKQPLHHACGWGHTDLATRLLKAGAVIESADVAGFTPLIYAAKEGHSKLVALLLDKGAKIEGADKMKTTPLMWAAIKGRKSCVELLLARGADRQAKTASGSTAHDLARGMGHKDLLPLLETKK